MLGDGSIGQFEVQELVDRPTEEIKRAIEGFFADARRDDLLLLYFSGHGVLSQSRRFFFATATTSLQYLRATAIEDGFVNGVMQESRARIDRPHPRLLSQRRVRQGPDPQERADGRRRAPMVVLLVENVRGMKALGRSFSLVKGRWWATFGTLIVAYLLITIVQLPLSFVLGVMFAAVDSEVTMAIVTTFVTIVGYAISLPLGAAITALIYFDLRIRKEGFDLELLAQRIGHEDGAIPGGVPMPQRKVWTPPGAQPYPQQQPPPAYGAPQPPPGPPSYGGYGPPQPPPSYGGFAPPQAPQPSSGFAPAPPQPEPPREDTEPPPR